MTGIVRLRVRFPSLRECVAVGDGPCRNRTCRYNLEHDESKGSRDNGGKRSMDQRLNREAAGTDGTTCAIEVANEGEHTLEEVAEFLGFTRQRVQQIESLALRKLERIADGFGEMPMVKLLRALKDG